MYLLLVQLKFELSGLFHHADRFVILMLEQQEFLSQQENLEILKYDQLHLHL